MLCAVIANNEMFSTILYDIDVTATERLKLAKYVQMSIGLFN